MLILFYIIQIIQLLQISAIVINRQDFVTIFLEVVSKLPRKPVTF